MGEGSGLGLAIVAALAQAHGGTAAVESVPGAGATFTVELPRSGPEGIGAGPAAPPGPDVGSGAGNAPGDGGAEPVVPNGSDAVPASRRR